MVGVNASVSSKKRALGLVTRGLPKSEWKAFCLGSLLTLIVVLAIMHSLQGDCRCIASSSSLLSVPPIEAPQERDFFAIAAETNTDKVRGAINEESCFAGRGRCHHPASANEKCRPRGHYYHTLYQHWLGRLSVDGTEPFQFLEIGFDHGLGFEAYSQFLPVAEKHSIEICCLPEGPRAEGKWPFGNQAENHPQYQELIDSNRLHCGDAANYEYLLDTWLTFMKRPDAPPLKVVVDDASHMAEHMARSLFFWFPRIEPGGYLFIEDIEPLKAANKFRTHVLLPLMKDLHYCGDGRGMPDDICFPTIQPLLAGIHCEMHICLFIRNDKPAVELDKEHSLPPPGLFDEVPACLFGSTN